MSNCIIIIIVIIIIIITNIIIIIIIINNNIHSWIFLFASVSVYFFDNLGSK